MIAVHKQARERSSIIKLHKTMAILPTGTNERRVNRIEGNFDIYFEKFKNDNLQLISYFEIY